MLDGINNITIFLCFACTIDPYQKKKKKNFYVGLFISVLQAKNLNLRIQLLTQGCTISTWKIYDS